MRKIVGGAGQGWSAHAGKMTAVTRIDILEGGGGGAPAANRLTRTYAAAICPMQEPVGQSATAGFPKAHPNVDVA